MGERKTLRLVAKDGDAGNLFGTDPAEVARKLDVLRRHCETEGTDYDRIAKTIIGGPDARDDPDGFLRVMAAYARLGSSTVWNGPAGPDPAAWVREVAPTVVPRLAEL